jgi:hypothetical protein
MKGIAVILVALLALAIWLGFLFIHHEPERPQYSAPLREAMNAVFSPLDSSAALPAEQIRSLMERATAEAGDEGRKEIAGLTLSLSRQLLAAGEERESRKARLKQISAAEVKTLDGSGRPAARQGPPAGQLKPAGKVKQIGQAAPPKAPTKAGQPSAPAERNVYVAAEKQRWNQYASAARAQCEELLRKIVDLEK